MNLADISIKRPIFITSVVILSLIAGLMSMSKLSVDLFPDVTFPVVFVATPYPGAGPSEIETLVSKPLEDEISGRQVRRTANPRSRQFVTPKAPTRYQRADHSPHRPRRSTGVDARDPRRSFRCAAL
jgi:HAE1 family hydrophobic/amphiphilic exporter-1